MNQQRSASRHIIRCPAAKSRLSVRDAFLGVALLLSGIVAGPVIAGQEDVRSVAPTFNLPGANGDVVSLEQLRGQVVYVDFWASWCPPCLKSFPWMNELATRHADAGLVVVAINLDSDDAAVRGFLDDVSADFTIALDPDASSAERYGLPGMPTSYVIDRQGRIAYTHTGFRRADGDGLERVVMAVLAEGDS